jgi:ankyrin repeat protein
MLVLSRDNYLQLMRLYPEQHETVLSNILSVYGVTRKGEIDSRSQASHLRDEDQAQLPRIRALIQASLRNANVAALSSLVDAAVMGNTEEVLRVVHLGLDINSVNYDGQTALHIMAKLGFKASVDALLKEGVNALLKDRWGRTALQVSFGRTPTPYSEHEDLQSGRAIVLRSGWVAWSPLCLVPGGADGKPAAGGDPAERVG